MILRRRLRRATASWLRRNPAVKHLAVASRSYLDSCRHSLAQIYPGIIRPQPGNLTVAITAHCNLRCRGCRYGRDFMPGKQLEWPLVRDLLDDGARAGFWSVRLYGGEPLLHPDLPRMVEHALARDLHPYVTTNAILLAEHIDELHRAGLRDLTIGFYGAGSHYDGYVQREGRFEKLERSLAGVRERYGDEINLRMNWLLMRPTCNQRALEAAWTFARRYAMPIQVDLIHYSLPYFSEGPQRELQFRPADRPAIERLVDQLLEYKRAHPTMIEHSLQGLRSIPQWLILGARMRIPCDKYQMIWVGADGSVQLCYAAFPLGNLHERRLATMLLSPEHRAAARRCFALDCPHCHCGYDSRILKHGPSRRRFAGRA